MPVYMYACMHVCMHACMYACMHVCTYACMHVCRHGCQSVCISVCMDGWMYVCRHKLVLHENRGGRPASSSSLCRRGLLASLVGISFLAITPSQRFSEENQIKEKCSNN